MSMQDVLVGVHSDASATADKLTQLTEKVATSYKSMAAHDAGMCSRFIVYIVIVIYMLV